MARRKKATRRRRDTRINVIQLGETLVYGNILSEYAFGTSLPGFIFEEAGADGVSLRDLIAFPAQRLTNIANNVGSLDRAIGAAGKAFMAGFAFSIGKKVLAMPRRKVNAGLKQLGVPLKM